MEKVHDDVEGDGDAESEAESDDDEEMPPGEGLVKPPVFTRDVHAEIRERARLGEVSFESQDSYMDWPDRSDIGSYWR